MSTVLFKIYAVLAAIFGVGLVFFVIAEPHEMSKLFALGLLWCAVGMFFNSKALITVTNFIERMARKLKK